MRRTLIRQGVILLLVVVSLALLLHCPPIEAFQSQSYTTVIMAIFKNESMILREWVEHYKWQGIDHILLLDNNSTDDWRSALAGLEEFVTVLPAKKIHAQEEHYNTIGKRWLDAHNVSFVGILDIDEYVFVKDGRSLASALTGEFEADPELSQLLVHWTMFGSSGHTRQPKSIRTSFLKRKRDLDMEHTKAFLRRSHVQRYSIHSSSVSGKTIVNDEEYRLNHYAIMSKEYFQNVKMTRGDVANQVYEKVRDWAYFKRYDHAEEEDRLLASRAA